MPQSLFRRHRDLGPFLCQEGDRKRGRTSVLIDLCRLGVSLTGTCKLFRFSKNEKASRLRSGKWEELESQLRHSATSCSLKTDAFPWGVSKSRAGNEDLTLALSLAALLPRLDADQAHALKDSENGNLVVSNSSNSNSWSGSQPCPCASWRNPLAPIHIHPLPPPLAGAHPVGVCLWGSPTVRSRRAGIRTARPEAPPRGP